MIYKVEAIVIHSQDYGEGSKILTLFSREMGKIALIAKGAKKTRSRFSAVTDLFTHGIFLFFKAGSGLGNLNQGDLLQSFRHLRTDLFASAYASYLIELTDKSVEERVPNPLLFQLLLDALTALDAGKDMEIVTRMFELQFLKAVGVEPELHSCASCRTTTGPFIAFSIKEGGFLCEGCVRKDPDSIILSQKEVYFLQKLSQIPILRFGIADLKDETRSKLKKVILSFMETYVPVQLKSRRVIEQLLKGTGNP